MEIIPTKMIEVILADREFAGEEWLAYLGKNQTLPFAIRVRKNEKIKHFNQMKLNQYFANMNIGETKTTDTKIYNSTTVKITGFQLDREQLLVVSNILIGDQALLAYKQRWSMERSFKVYQNIWLYY